MSAERVDFWVELPSPLKVSVRNAFYAFEKKIYDEKGIIISSYFPSSMGGDMKNEDYLSDMSEDFIPENYLGMSFGEISSNRFIKKLIYRDQEAEFFQKSIYSHNEIVAWFSETMVVDTKRLKGKPLPKSFIDLADPIYRGEVCIIGTPEIPDPLSPLFIFRKYGEKSMLNFIENIAGFGAPVNAIRHIGKNTNSFGSIFIMPLLFANVCREVKGAVVVEPGEGYFAEPFVLLSKNAEDEKTKIIRDFLHSNEFENAFSEKDFLVSNKKNDRKICDSCKACYFPELEKIYPLLREKLGNFSK